MQGSLLILLAIFLMMALYAAARGIAAAAEPPAAQTESDLSIGREIQKKFIPLELDKNGSKLNYGYTETETAAFFGYYAEADGISGDYFDYLKLDDSRYAIIKCDIAGKGIPAALIMVQVATMFLNYFRQWKPLSGEMRIEKLVYQINDFIETLGFKDRFAAFTLCVFNTQTGSLRFCNAGDNIIHLYDASAGCIRNITLPQTPAAGIFPNSVVESKGGYQAQELTLDHGDILLLYTDGIEEAKRGGKRGEELGSEQVYDIVNAVMNRGQYRLYDLHFDFSGCGGGVDELVMALVAVEKLFRCRHDPRAPRDEWALANKKLDAFLAAHFLQYQKYCAQTCAYPDNDLYIYYTHLREDEQYDDLTILGVKRK
jgi:serine phosphatase RsbU (regulator of sigma subunit)